MKILITGANGFLGQHFCKYFAEKKYWVVATGRGEQKVAGHGNLEYVQAELTNEKNIEDLLNDIKPDIVIHAAAMSKPDECEKHRELAWQVNVQATANLLKYHSSKFIYISSDFIFGDNGPHSEDETPAPLNYYGETKLQAEYLVKNSGLPFAIIRPVLIYGEQVNKTKLTFLHWVKQNLENGKQIKVVSDQLRSPTYVIDICKAAEAIIKLDRQGAYNIAGKDFITPYDMAIKIAKVLGLDDSLVEKVNSAIFFEPVKRAKKAGLKIEKARKELNYNPVSFEEGVRLSFGL